MPDFSFRQWFEGNDLPADIQNTLFAKGLNRQIMSDNAVKISQELDKKHANDPYWQQNVIGVKKILHNAPLIHTTSLKSISLIWNQGIMPSSELVKRKIINQDKLAFDAISGLDRATFYRQGEPAGRYGSIGVLVDPYKLDPNKIIVSKLGFMALKQKEDSILRKPGDHIKLVDAQLRRYRKTTLNFEDVPTIQAKYLVDSYLSEHPGEANKALDFEKVASDENGQVEIKYVGTVTKDQIVGFLCPEDGVQTLQQLKVPLNMIKTYHGGFSELEALYKRLYLRQPTHMK
jgi:hypothetical protein